MLLPLKSQIDYSQLHHIYDMACFGNCYAYTVLFLTYTNLYHLQHDNVDYKVFKKSLENYSNKDKKAINDKQTLYSCNKQLLDHELAIINKNTSLCYSATIEKIDALLNQARQKFQRPAFYFLSIEDEKQTLLRQPLAHEIGIYLPSPYELHVFDSNSGLYIFYLPDNISKGEIGETLIDIIFKKNIMFKLFFTPNSSSLSFNLEKSEYTDQLDAQQQHLKELLQQFIDNPKLSLEPTALKDKFSNDEKIQHFLQMNLFMLKQQYLQQQASHPNFLAQKLFGFWRQPKKEKMIEMQEISKDLAP